MQKLSIAVFGEAERGLCSKDYYINSLESLLMTFGNPPENSLGLFMAIQALLYNSHLLYFRVTEEGFSLDEYFHGFKLLEERKDSSSLHCLALPGVGDKELIDATKKICTLYNSLLILTQKDLYDYLTSFPKELR